MRTINFDGVDYFITELAAKMIHAALKEHDAIIKEMYQHKIKNDSKLSIMTPAGKFEIEKADDMEPKRNIPP